MYATGSFLSQAISIVALAVVTRFLEPGAFGQLAVLTVFSGLLSILYTLAVLQGTFGAAFGRFDEDEDAGGDTAEPAQYTGDARRAVGTGLVLATAASIVGTGLIALAAVPLADLLVGEEGSPGSVILAALAAAVGAVWRLLSNIPRMERRPKTFVLLASARPLFILATSVPLLASGLGVDGALLGLFLGTAGADALALWRTRTNFRLAFDPRVAARILSGGRPYAVLILAFWIVHSGDTLIASRVASDADVAFYRVASRVTSAQSYLASAFLMAWTPLQGTSAYTSVTNERGDSVTNGMIWHYGAVAGLWMVLGMAVLGSELARVAPDSYSNAASLMPVLSLGFLTYGMFLVSYRTVWIPRKRRRYIELAVISTVIFGIAAVALGSWSGVIGVAAAPAIGFLVGTTALMWLSQRGFKPLEINWPRLLAAAATAIACYGLALLLGPALGVVGDLAALVAYPLLLVATRTVPSGHVRGLRRIGREMTARRAPADALVTRLAEIDPPDAALLELTCRHRLSLGALEASTSVTQAELGARYVAALRSVAELGPPEASDPAVAAVLLSDRPILEKDHLLRRLVKDGVMADTLDDIEHAAQELSRLPASAWAAATVRPQPIQKSFCSPTENGHTT